MVNLLDKSEEGLGVLKKVPRKSGLFFGLWEWGEWGVQSHFHVKPPAGVVVVVLT